MVQVVSYFISLDTVDPISVNPAQISGKSIIIGHSPQRLPILDKQMMQNNMEIFSLLGDDHWSMQNE